MHLNNSRRPSQDEPPTLWQKSLLPMVQAVMRLPGRK
jgi:hypothetical protein